VNNAGGINWSSNFGGTKDEWGNCIDVTDDGGVICGAGTSSENGDVVSPLGDEDVWILKLNGSGNLEWQKSLGGSSDEWSRNIITLAKDSFMVAATVKSGDDDVVGHHGNADFWLVRLGKKSSVSAMNLKLDRLEMYPNPAQEIVFIQLNENNSKTEYLIRDCMGRIVQKGFLPLNGSYINIIDLKPALYNISVIQNDIRFEKMLLVLR